MNRIDRLFAILMTLQRGTHLRAGDLAARFEVSERTIYRDMKALAEMGVPVVADGLGYQLLDTFSLPPVALDEAEARATFLALRMFIRNSTGDIKHHAAAVLDKIEAVLSDSARAEIQSLAALIDFFPADRPFAWDDPLLKTLLDAIRYRRVVRFAYRAYQHPAPLTRTVEPHHLTHHDGVWYVHGFCRLRNDNRSFRLNRMADVQLLDELFTPRSVFPPKEEVQTVRVHFSETVAPYVRERQHYGFSGEDEGVMLYQVKNLREIRGWLLGFGAEANVLAPESLRTWLYEEAQRLIKHLT